MHRSTAVPRPEVVDVAATAHALESCGLSISVPGSDSLPTIVCASTELGLVAIDFVVETAEPLKDLNRRVAQLRAEVPEIVDAPVQRFLVGSAGSAHQRVVSVEQASDAVYWAAVLAEQRLSADEVAAVERTFAPRATIAVPMRADLSDPEAPGRATMRILLDVEQSEAVRRETDDVIIVSGPPGSGKTLVLAARANWLADQHPSWRIALLCYNRLLVPYLAGLVAGHDNIIVSTFGRFCGILGVRISLDDETRAKRNVQYVLPNIRSSFDAILVDEWQDFMAPWTDIVLAALRPGKGGVALAGDPNQALYREAPTDFDFRGRKATRVEFARPYRSTRQILEVAQAMDESLLIEGIEGAPDGRPVDLVWTENVEALADAIAFDIKRLVHSGERRPQDIGVVATRKFQMNQLFRTITRIGVRARVVWARDAEEYQPASPEVKIVTAHSAKGYEFDVVFLAGLENLPSPDGTPEGDRQARTGYVGATRARDQLILTYSKSNRYLDNIRNLPDSVVKLWVWPDDYPGAS